MPTNYFGIFYVSWRDVFKYVLKKLLFDFCVNEIIVFMLNFADVLTFMS